MKHHLGTVKPTSIVSKPHVASHVHNACSCTVVEQPSELEQLKKLVTQIQNQLSTLTTIYYQGSKSKPVSNSSPSDKAKYVKSSTQICPGYCFNCGEDGHIPPTFDQAPNPSLVALKKKQLQEKR